MERVLSTEERIKRAEELYKSKQDIRNTKKENNLKISKYKAKLLKKMIVQMLICLTIYSLFYYVKNSEEIFSKDLINKTKEILGYDINFNKLYNDFSNWLVSQKIFNTDEEKQNTIENELQNVLRNEITENIGGAEEEKKEETNLSQMEIDANEIKSKYKLIKPIQGTITSRYGKRNPTTATVPKNHTGIDIAANVGTVIYAALDGVVKIASSEGDYGNHLRIEKDDVAIYYAHCNKLYVKEGEYVKQNQPIAEVGATGNVTGPHLHFEIRKNERYVNPDMVLEF